MSKPVITLSDRSRNTLFAAFVAVCAVALASCATMSEEECLYIDWEVRGVLDGNVGEPASRIDRYQRTCDRYSVQVDREAYERGRLEGVQSYCTPDNGFDVGLRGDSYKYACPLESERAFLSGYRPARSLYDARSYVYQMQARISGTTSAIARLEDRIQSTERELQESGLTDSERDNLRARIRRIQRDIDDEREQRITAQIELPEAIRRCNEVRDRVEQMGYDVPLRCD